MLLAMRDNIIGVLLVHGSSEPCALVVANLLVQMFIFTINISNESDPLVQNSEDVYRCRWA